MHVGAVVEAELLHKLGEPKWYKGTVTRVNAAARSFRATFCFSEDGETIDMSFSMKKEGIEWRWSAADACASLPTETQVFERWVARCGSRSSERL